MATNIDIKEELAAFLAASAMLEHTPFPTERLIPTDMPTFCVLPKEAADTFEETLRDQGIISIRLGATSLGTDICPMTWDDATSILESTLQTDQVWPVVFSAPFDPESVQREVANMLSPKDDPYWTALAAFLAAHKRWDEKWCTYYSTFD